MRHWAFKPAPWEACLSYSHEPDPPPPPHTHTHPHASTAAAVSRVVWRPPFRACPYLPGTAPIVYTGPPIEIKLQNNRLKAAAHIGEEIVVERNTPGFWGRVSVCGGALSDPNRLLVSTPPDRFGSLPL